MRYKYKLVDITKTFSFFKPASAGSNQMLASQTIKVINQTFPAIFTLMNSLDISKEIIDPKDFCQKDNLELSTKLKVYFDRYGSDKANLHNYHYIYAQILSPYIENLKIFEIGLGTNNVDTLSNMGKFGKPGASLRAFRDSFPRALIHGADVDRRILFDDIRIQTFHLDQTDPKSFDKLFSEISNDYYLVIDDGLHAPNSNILSLTYGLGMIRNSGWVVIEDIPLIHLGLWEMISVLLPANFKSYLIRDELNLVFAVQKVD